MLTSNFDYELPEECIASHPPARRDGARMLIVNGSSLSDDWVSNFCEMVPPGSLVVVNDSRVRRARVLAHRRHSGGKVEFLLLEHLATEDSGDGLERWKALGRPSRVFRKNEWFDGDGLEIRVLGRDNDGLFTVEVRSTSGDEVEAVLVRCGHVPIPPYLHREDEDSDVDRYQTVYAKGIGSVAAPTAGLHLTERALSRLQERGIDIGAVTLHVGIGTFRPVAVDDLDLHPMHTEWFSIGSELAEQLRAARCRAGRVVAVGTTAVRALESAADPSQPGMVIPTAAQTNLLIQPGYKFKIVDSLLTNFHQPRSTLLALVSAAVGVDAVRLAYRTAIDRGYRFLSYGDAMWIPEIDRC